MKVYKIRHKPTGLYFTPSRGHGNLSTKGKIYSMKPQVTNWLAGGIRIVLRKTEKTSKKQRIIMEHFNLEFGDKYSIDQHFYTPYEEWEILEL